MSDVVKVIVVNDELTDCEAMYVDGKLGYSDGGTVSALDVARYVEGQLVHLEYKSVIWNAKGDWPEDIQPIIDQCNLAGHPW